MARRFWLGSITPYRPSPGARSNSFCGDLNLSWTLSAWPGILTTTTNYEIKWRGHIAL